MYKMPNYKNVLMILVLIFFGTAVSFADEPAKDEKEDIGKSNPFKLQLPVKEQVVIEVPKEKDVEPEPEVAAEPVRVEPEKKVKPDMYIETMMLNFLRAENIQSAVLQMNSEYGTVAVDTETNSLIICDTREKLDLIKQQVYKADQTPKQIQIEVVIVDVQLDDSTEIGVNWDDLNSKSHTVKYKQTLIDELGFSATSQGAGFSIINNSIKTTIHALQDTKNVEILASPRVMVVSGGEAFIQTVEEIPYRELTDSSDGGQGALASTEFKNAGVTLTVKATITDDGLILMKIEPEQSVNTGRTGLGGDVPIVDKRIAKTTLLLRDSQVVVMGGLRRKETTIQQTKIPILGDLPLIGMFFSNDKKVVKNSELLVLISPHVYNDSLGPSPMELYRFNQLKDQLPLQLKTGTKDKVDLLGQRPEYRALENIAAPFSVNQKR